MSPVTTSGCLRAVKNVAFIVHHLVMLNLMGDAAEIRKFR
jgi:hypothetical protein